MKRFRWPTILITITSLIALIGPATVRAEATWWQPTAVNSWQWQLTWPVDTSVAAEVYDIDYDASESGTPAKLASIVNTLHAQGKKAICYLETGSWENYRPDAGEYPASILGNTLSGYASERYVDIRQLDTTTGPTGKTLHQILAARFQQCKNEGFDGIETDIDDSYASDTGFPLTRQDQETFNAQLAADIHGLGLAWFLKNGINQDDFVVDMAPIADGTINEQCWQYNECAALRPFVALGKPILNAEYTGQKAIVCPKALAFPTTTMRKTTGLTAKVTWACWQ